MKPIEDFFKSHEEPEDINEFLIPLLCSGLTSYIFGQLIWDWGKRAKDSVKSAADKAKDTGSKISGFFSSIINKFKKHRDGEESDESEDHDTLVAAKMINDSMPDGEEKENSKKLLDVASSTVYDEDGNYIPRDKREEKLNDVLKDSDIDAEDLKNDIERKSEELEKSDIDKELDKIEKKVNPSKEDYEAADKDIKSAAKDMKKKSSEDPNYMKKLGEDIKKSTSSSIKDNPEDSKDTEKDSKDSKSDSNKETTKKETVTDPTTGKEVNAVVHTGPRGGKWFKNSEGGKSYLEPGETSKKVKVKESLRDFLVESMTV